MRSELIRIDYEIIKKGLELNFNKKKCEIFTQSDKGVPSSANWKPTKPFNNRHQNVAHIKPI